MKERHFKRVLASTLALSLLLSPTLFMRTQATAPTDALKDHWDFQSLTSDQNTTATLEGTGVALADSGNPVFGSVLRFGSGTDNYMRLADYINTGAGATSFSLWYRYDTSITGDNSAASTTILQNEGNGRSILTLRSNGKYHTYLNGTDVISPTTVEKGDWQHITVTFDQNAKKVKFYINGELDSEQNLGNNSINEMLSLRLGAHKNKGSTDPHPMRGDVDELYVYEKVLTDQEAKVLYEDKAFPLYQFQLKTLMDQGQELYNSSQLEPDHINAQQLATALEQAQQAQGAQTLDQLKPAYEALEQAIAAYRSALPLHLTIDPETVQRQIDVDSIFGINHRYSFNGYGSFDPTTMSMREDFVELYKQAGFGSVRYPGGTISNLFNWKTTLGPVEERKNQIHGFYNSPGQGGIAPNFGIGEVADLAELVDSEITYTYSLARGNAQDAADLVEYLNAQVGTNPNGGIDWAQVRADNGHPEPYNVRYFEIGNEMQQAYGESQDGTTSQGYWTQYVTGGAEKAYTEGGTASFTQKYTVLEEDWNKVASQSDGSANQVRFLRYANLNPGMLDENGNIVDAPNFKAMNDGVRVYVGLNGVFTEWTVVDSLENSTATDQHCVVNYANGSIQFGDGVHGQIPPKGQTIHATYTVERDGFIDISKAIKETTAQINAAEGTNHQANVYSSFESKSFITRMANLNANEWYDGIVVHPYSGTVSGGNDANAFYDDAMKKAETAGIGLVQEFAKALPEGKVPVVSEFGIFRNREAQVRSQTHALYIAKVMMEYVRLGSPYIQKHCLVDYYNPSADALGPNQQAVIQAVAMEGANTATGEGDYKFFSTPSAHVFQMLNSGFGENILEASLDSTPTMSNGVTSLSTLASQDKDGNFYIALVNVDREQDRSVQLDISGADLTGRTLSIQTLASESITDENTLDNPNNVAIETTQVVSQSSAPTVLVPKHSFVVVKVAKAEEVQVDKTQLEAGITKAEALRQEDYTAQSWSALQSALAAAKTVFQDSTATQPQVDEALTALRQAVQALVSVPQPTPAPTESPVPTSPPTPEVTAAPENTPAPTQPGESVPETGDSVTLWPVAGLLLSLGGLVLVTYRRRRV